MVQTEDRVGHVSPELGASSAQCQGGSSLAGDLSSLPQAPFPAMTLTVNPAQALAESFPSGRPEM